MTALESPRLVEHMRAAHGWPALRLGVRPENSAALAFWRHLGSRVVARGERAIIMETAL